VVTSLLFFFFGVLLLKLLYPTCRIDQLLPAGKKGMAFGANVDFNIRLGRTGVDYLTAGTTHC
jgi:hypothetical protein